MNQNAIDKSVALKNIGFFIDCRIISCDFDIVSVYLDSNGILEDKLTIR